MVYRHCSTAIKFYYGYNDYLRTMGNNKTNRCWGG